MDQWDPWVVLEFKEKSDQMESKECAVSKVTRVTVDCVVHKGFVVRRVFLDPVDLVGTRETKGFVGQQANLVSVVCQVFRARLVMLDQLDLVDLAVCLVKEVSQDLLVSVAAVVQMVHLVHVGHEVLWEHLAKLVLLERRGCRVILESEAQLESVDHWESAGKRARMAPMGRKAKMVGVGCQAKLVSQAVRALVVVKDQLVWAWLVPQDVQVPVDCLVCKDQPVAEEPRVLMEPLVFLGRKARMARMERMASMASLALMVNLDPMVKRDPRVTAARVSCKSTLMHSKAMWI